jgi:hypothetical protein
MSSAFVGRGARQVEPIEASRLEPSLTSAALADRFAERALKGARPASPVRLGFGSR